MTPQEFHLKAKEIVGTVLERLPGERAAYLEHRCGDDEALLREVQSLLDFEARPEVFSGKPIISLQDDDNGEPERVGPYMILRRLGRGGMGDVYLARQDEPVRRRVALKLIHRGMVRDDVVHRFRLERNVLANLHHPYIASLLDGGATDDGRPYFAMEYVDGEPIDVYCDRARLSLRQRLELFCKVCSAVQLSHQNLVVHRDLKPDNILVDASGTPKLLDFGIAKLLGGEPGAQTAFVTTPGRAPMTLGYASPEMIQGDGVTTATDIYSLGVLLYRLLSGHHPYRLANRSPVEIFRVICDDEPKRPSTAVGATEAIRTGEGRLEEISPQVVSERRGSEPARLRRQLLGDLDGIVLKALRKEPRERYGSVVELSQDIRSYLKGLPVAARADTFRYRAGKFVRRHRWGVATAAAFLALVVSFAVVAASLFEQTLEERNRATMSRDLFVEILESTNPQTEAENLTVEEVVQRGVELYDESFRQELHVQADVFNSLGLIYTSRGHYNSARPLLEKSLRIRKAIFGDRHLLVAVSLINQAHLLGEIGEHEQAERLSREGLALLRQHFRKPHLSLAKGINTHATQLFRLARLDEAEALYQESLTMKIDLYGEDHLQVATSLANMASLHLEKKDYEAALRFSRKALRIRSARIPETHPKLARTYHKLGVVLADQRVYEKAIPLLREALRIRRHIQGDQHPDVARSLYSLAFCLHRLGHFSEAEKLYRNSEEIWCKLHGDHDHCLLVRKKLVLVLAAEGKVKAAHELARQVLGTSRRTQSKEDWRLADAKSVLGVSLTAQQRYEEAEALLLESYPVILEAKGEAALWTLDARQRICHLYNAWGKPEKASAYCDISG